MRYGVAAAVDYSTAFFVAILAFNTCLNKIYLYLCNGVCQLRKEWHVPATAIALFLQGYRFLYFNSLFFHIIHISRSFELVVK